VVVICPKCRRKLKVDEKIQRAKGSILKCSQCNTFFVVKVLSVSPKKTLDQGKILIAHSNPLITNEIVSLLTKKGYVTTTSSHGIEAIVKAIKEVPFLLIIELELPKIHGLEVCRRIKATSDIKDIKFIFVVPAFDYAKRLRENSFICSAEDVIEDRNVAELLIERIDRIKGVVTRKMEEPPIRFR